MKIARNSLVLVAFAFVMSPLAAHAQYAGGGVDFLGFGPTSGVSGQESPGESGRGQVLGASAYNFTSDLHYGSTGEDVTQLQTILIADGYLHISAPTGWFGPLTRAAVMQYQASHNITATGFVGPLTLAALNAGTTPTTPETEPTILKWIGSTSIGKTVEAALKWSAST